MPSAYFFRFLTFVLICCGTLFSPCQQASGDIYRYVDERGVVHFSNTPNSPEYIFYMKEEPLEDDPDYINRLVSEYADRFKLEKELVCAVIKVESNYNPKAVSTKGAQGLMQIIPETALDLKIDDPFDVRQNIRGGSQYLRLMLDQFSDDLDLALAAYNAGPGTVRAYGGIPPFKETMRYIEKVKTYLHHYRALKEKSL